MSESQLLQLDIGRASLAGGEDAARVFRRDGLADEPRTRVVGGAERGPEPEVGARSDPQSPAAGGLFADAGADGGLPVSGGLLNQRRLEGLVRPPERACAEPAARCGGDAQTGRQGRRGALRCGPAGTGTARPRPWGPAG
jgi:hypothetical protein